MIKSGETKELKDARISSWDRGVKVEDMTHAGKRGKKVVEYVVDGYFNEDALLQLKVSLDKAEDITECLMIMTKAVENGEGLQLSSRHLKAVHVAPIGFESATAGNDKMYISVGFDSYRVRDLEDQMNEPTIIHSSRDKKVM